MSIVFVVLAAPVVLIGGAALTLAASRSQRSRDHAIATFDFGSAAQLALRRRRPELASPELELAWQGLRQYFRVCLRGGRQTMPMPSQLVDDAWHAFILDTPRYARFCHSAFGRFLHHRPDTSGKPHDATHRRVEGNPAWQIGRRFLPEHGPSRLPLLFAIDEALNIADGFRYLPPDPGLRRTATTAVGSYGCSGCASDSGSASDSGGGDSHGHSGCSSSCSGGCSGGGH
jgi:hypothetical protein